MIRDILRVLTLLSVPFAAATCATTTEVHEDTPARTPVSAGAASGRRAHAPAPVGLVLTAIDGNDADVRDLGAALDVLGATQRDASDVHARLFAPVFDLNRATPPVGWPAAHRATWDDALSTCNALRSDETFTVHDTSAWLCAQATAPWLWDRFVDDIRPSRVLEVSVERKDPMAHPHRREVTVVSYAPGATRAWRTTVGVDGDDGPDAAVAALARALARVFADNATRVTRTRASSPPSVRVPRADAPPTAPAVPARFDVAGAAPVVPAGCELPSTIEWHGPPGSMLTSTMAALYAARVPADVARGAPARCTVAVDEVADAGAGAFGLHGFGLHVRCGERRAVLRLLGTDETSAARAGAVRGLEQLVRQLCSAPREGPSAP